ncbi:DUF3040 domain-containing protein [Pseudarthrobacter sp. NamE2]|nr:DUF3040 domain-containing protein [Pseudarthrobacter sp. NamE2]
MPMSEEERRLLNELELRLIADDPHLAMELLSGYPARRVPAGLFAGSVVCLLGLVLVMAGIGSQAAAAVVVGILLLALGACLFLNRPFPRRQREQSTG